MKSDFNKVLQFMQTYYICLWIHLNTHNIKVCLRIIIIINKPSESFKQNCFLFDQGVAGAFNPNNMWYDKNKVYFFHYMFYA